MRVRRRRRKMQELPSAALVVVAAAAAVIDSDHQDSVPLSSVRNGMHNFPHPLEGPPSPPSDRAGESNQNKRKLMIPAWVCDVRRAGGGLLMMMSSKAAEGIIPTGMVLSWMKIHVVNNRKESVFGAGRTFGVMTRNGSRFILIDLSLSSPLVVRGGPAGGRYC